MYQINPAFFLIGALIFLVIKFTSELRLFGEDPLRKVPKRWAGTIFNLFIGSIFFFTALNVMAVMIQIAIFSPSPSHGIIYLIPLVLLFLHSITFISPAFIKTTLNYLLAILISTIIIVVLMLILSALYPYYFVDIGLGLLPHSLFFGLPIGWFSGLLIYLALKKFNKKYNEDLWDISESKYIQFFRNDWFEISLIIITFIVAWIYIPL